MVSESIFREFKYSFDHSSTLSTVLYIYLAPSWDSLLGPRETHAGQDGSIMHTSMHVTQSTNTTRLEHQLELRVQRQAQPSLDKRPENMTVGDHHHIDSLLVLHCLSLEPRDFRDCAIEPFSHLLRRLTTWTLGSIPPDVPRLVLVHASLAPQVPDFLSVEAFVVTIAPFRHVAGRLGRMTQPGPGFRVAHLLQQQLECPFRSDPWTAEDPANPAGFD